MLSTIHRTKRKNRNKKNLNRLKNKRSSERRAIWPLHFVDFGCINGIQISLTGISPLDNQNYENMHLPYALYEISLTNTGDTDATTSFAFQWNDDKTPFITLPKKGFYNDEWCILVKSNIGKAKISIGDDTDNHFLSDGECSLSDTSSPTRKIAVKATLNAHETQKIHLVLAWYNRTDPEIAFYKNKYQNPKGIAEHGMKVFSSLKNNAEKLVNGIRESNLARLVKKSGIEHTGQYRYKFHVQKRRKSCIRRRSMDLFWDNGPNVVIETNHKHVDTLLCLARTPLLGKDSNE